LNNPVTATTQVKAQQCGVIQEGLSTPPWTAIIYGQRTFNAIKVNYTTGMIISTRHIYSNAVSLFDFAIGTYTKLDNLRVYVGLDSIASIDNATHFSIQKTYIHPDFKIMLPLPSNLAVIVLENELTYGQNIAPICLWDSARLEQDFTGQTGYSFGYGKPLIPLKIHDSSKCASQLSFLSLNLRSNVDSFFCAGGDGKLCWMDEFSLSLKQQNVWFLYGIGSYLNVTNSKSCSNTTPVLFEYARYYEDWLKDKIIKT